MKVRLENFKCYREREFTLPDSGILLLSGESGRGKSTLLNAIMFAVTGEGKSVFSFGATKCKVELEFRDLLVCRTRRPNRLTVKHEDTTLEDDEAQELLNRCFGPFFQRTSYVMQGSFTTFLYLSPTEKLEFLEQFVFKHLDLGSKKDRLKDMLKERSTRLTELRAKEQTLSGLVASALPVELPPYPIKSTPATRPALRKKYEDLRTRFTDDVTTADLGVKAALARQAEIRQAEDRIASLQGTLALLTQRAESITNQLSTLPLLKEEADTARMVTTIREMEEVRTVLARCTIEDTTEQSARLAEARASLWTDGSAEELAEHIQNYRAMIADVERKDAAERRLTTLPPPSDVDDLKRKVHDAEVYRKRFKCPSCSHSLAYDGTHLVRAEQCRADPSQLADLRSKLAAAETAEAERSRLTGIVQSVVDSYDELHPVADVTGWLTDALSYVAENTEREKQCAVLQSRLRVVEKANAAAETARAGALATLARLGTSEDGLDSALTTLRDRYAEARAVEVHNQQVSRQRTDLEAELASTSRRISEAKVEIEERSRCRDGVVDVDGAVHALTEAREKLGKVVDILQRMDAYDRAQAELDRIRTLEGDLAAVRKRVATAEDRFKSALTLKEKLSIAESVYLERTLGELNMKVQDNLNLFFQDEPIVVSLETFRESKDKKEVRPQINVQVLYKGADMDVASLSGGERDRVNLAIVLALNEIFDSPLLMLDECISSLDYGNFSRVVEALQESMVDKLVLLVSHQAEEGQFDAVVPV